MTQHNHPTMDYAKASEKIRAFAAELAVEIVKDMPQSNSLTIERAVVVALLTAYCDSVRAEWAGWIEASPQMKAQFAVAKELMRDNGYADMDPVCGVPGVEPMIATIDGRKAVSFEHSLTSAMPLSAIFMNKVREVMDAAEKVAAATADKPSDQPKEQTP